ncbi:hypothetical protein WOLCODRAFT_147241 [Wolfiporia cocos MD-104 SS10]|uniref:Uncharacterized protein n=1 Tax=Wolfiporia cocos (strain MD-104) TaxID=742152 RepID=A0A2H3ITV3_WOLCO|nr:hypothetical protein WOLCODRAFT_147241 [Wolfiporia cocos MD-104 SS10]
MQARGVPAPPRAPSLQSTAHCGADRLNNRALGLDDPQLHPAPRAYPLGRTNARGIASVPAPVTRATARQAGYSPSAHGGTIRLNNWDLRRCSGLTTKHPRLSVDPRGNPARAPIERGAASARDSPTLGIGQPQSTRAPRRTTPAATTVSHQRKAIRQGQPPSSIRHSRKPQPTPPSVSNARAGKGARSPRQPAAHRVERQRRLPKQPRHPFRRPRQPKARSRQAARQRVGRGADHTNTPLGPATWSYHTPTASHSNRATAALKAYQGTVRIENGTGTRRDGYRASRPRLLDTSHRHHSHSPPGQGISLPRQCHRLSGPLRHRPRQAASDATSPASSGVPGASAAARRQTPSTLPRYSQGAGGDYNNLLSNHPLKSQRAPPNAQGNRLTANRYQPPWIATPPPPLKQRQRPGKQVSEGHNRKKAKNAPMGAERARRARPATYTTPRAVRSLRTPLRHRPSRISNRPAQA